MTMINISVFFAWVKSDASFYAKEKENTRKAKGKKCWIVNCNWHVCLLKQYERILKNIKYKTETFMSYGKFILY